MSGSHYKELIRSSLAGADGTDSTQRKKRRGNFRETVNNAGSSSPQPTSQAHVNSDGKSESDAIIIDDEDNDDHIPSDISSESNDNSDSDEDFEDVDIEANVNYNFDQLAAEHSAREANDSITINLGNKEESESEATKGGKRKVNIISKEERKFRVWFHQVFLICMLIHGAQRNAWCNSSSIQNGLRKFAPRQALDLLDQDDEEILEVVKARRFLDGLRKLMALYSQKFKRTSKGLIRKNWNELNLQRTKVDQDLSFQKFRKLVLSFRGSRDVGAQGFVAFLRSIGLQTRLVFSIQTPDFTSTSEYPKIETNTLNTPQPPQIKKKQAPSSSLIAKFGGAGGNKRNFLGELRSAQPIVADSPSSSVSAFSSDPFSDDSEYPIFWVEVWNKYNKKWVSIDPISLKVIENAPMRKKSAFEPPSTDLRNQLVYAIAYDSKGGVKDVTRRYSHYFNAKTSKKRVSYRLDKTWYERIISAATSKRRQKGTTKLDALELKEFYDRDLAEGMPNNIADFKNHPLYALESQLRQTEVIYPMDKSSQCGMFRNRTKSKNKSNEVVFPVYKRSHVFALKSAKAWYMRGRVLKVGAQPLKIKKVTRQQQQQMRSTYDDDSDGDGIDDDDNMVRLYAEFQTSLYVPPPIVDGRIPKNAFGNIDLYTPTMIPEGGFLVRADEPYNMKMIERAAKYILEIDYARAIVGFDFGGSGKKKSQRRIPTAKEGGILIDEQFTEAIVAVLDSLVEEEEQNRRDVVERNSLHNWKYFLTKLRISHRLDMEHGVVDEEIQSSRKRKSKKNTSDDGFSSDDDSDVFSVESDSSGEEIEFGGGFVPGDYQDNEQMEDDTSNRGVQEGSSSLEPDTENGEQLRARREVRSLSEDTNEEENVSRLEGNKHHTKTNRFENDYGSDEDEEEFGGGGFFVDNEMTGNQPDNTAEEESDFGGGGFLVEDNESPHDTKPYEQDSSEEDFLNSIPESYFKKNDVGELVYDPEESESAGAENFTVVAKVPEKAMEAPGGEYDFAAGNGEKEFVHTSQTGLKGPLEHATANTMDGDKTFESDNAVAAKQEVGAAEEAIDESKDSSDDVTNDKANESNIEDEEEEDELSNKQPVPQDDEFGFEYESD